VGLPLLPDEIAISITCGIAFLLAASAVLKVVSPDSVEPFTRELGLVNVPPAAIAVGAAGLELVAAVGLFLGMTWGWILAVLLLAAFSVALVLVLRRGARPRCGCLGDLSAASVGHAQLGRNVVLIVALLASVQAPTDRPLAAVPAALLVAALSVVVPEAIETIVQFRAAAKAEIAQVRAQQGKT
jgi:hypothetical protein